MPKGKPLTDEQYMEIYEARMLGESRQEIARAYGIAATSVSKIVAKQRQLLEKEDNMAGKQCVVAGNKKDGRLVSTLDPHRYEGTCVVAGKANSKSFNAESAAAATKLWEQWCNELRAKHQKPVIVPEKKQTTVVEKQPVVEVAPPKKEEPKVIAAHKTDETNKESVYIIWTKGDNPRLFGAYSSIDAALRELDNLNEISSFLVNDRVFDVDELPLKS